jgi:ATP-binding cassette subfamily B protein
MKPLLRFLKPYKILLVIGPIFKLLEAILELMLPFLMSKIIDVGVAKHDTEYVIKMGIIMLITAIVGILCALVCQYSASIVSQGTGTDIRNALFQHIGTFSNLEVDQFGTGSLINRITNDVNQVQLAVAMLIRLVIRAPFLCIGGMVATFLIDVNMSFIILIVIPVFILILYLTMKVTIPLYRTVQHKLDTISRALRENLNGVRVIRAFTREELEKERFEVHNQEYQDNAIRVGRMSALLNPLTSLVMNVAIGAILWFGGIRVNAGSTTTGEVIAFIGYVGQILISLIIISNLVIIFTKAFASAGRISEVLTTQSEITNPIKAAKPVETPYAVEFDHVSMSYNQGSEYAIKDITFKIKKGQTVGIIGGTGSGKSTIINLIPRFYECQKGQILVNGLEVRDYDLDVLRNSIGIVPQQTVLFTGTIKENIQWGKQDATTEEIERAAKNAQAMEFINKLPEGIETKIYRGGVNVSGGQRQRITIARALVRKPNILILDDSFSALDYATDAALRKALEQNKGDRTTFLISQRASTIRNADQIIVLSDGEIVGMGTHEELITECEVYQEICQSQMQEEVTA